MYWSWILMAIGITGLYLVSQKKRVGWIIGIFAQFLWIAYALLTKQYGFLVSAFAYGLVNVLGLRKSYQTETKEPKAPWHRPEDNNYPNISDVYNEVNLKEN